MRTVSLDVARRRIATRLRFVLPGRTARDWAERGILPGRKLHEPGGHWYLLENELEDWIQSREIELKTGNITDTAAIEDFIRDREREAHRRRVKRQVH